MPSAARSVRFSSPPAREVAGERRTNGPPSGALGPGGAIGSAAVPRRQASPAGVDGDGDGDGAAASGARRGRTAALRRCAALSLAAAGATLLLLRRDGPAAAAPPGSSLLSYRALATSPDADAGRSDRPEMVLDTELVGKVDRHPYSLLRDVADPVNLHEDLPYFWHVHKSGGSTMKHILYCLDRAQTRRINEEGCWDGSPLLQVCARDFGMGMEQRIINADASSVPGIDRAIKLKLAERTFRELEDDPAGPAFVVDTSRVYEALPIFTPRRRGRLFVVFRHPVERAVSKYHYIKIATWERNYRPRVANMTLMEYAESGLCYSDWMTRRLVHKMKGDLTPDDLALAKEVLRRKALVLLTEDMAGAVERVRGYFGWDDDVLNLDAEHRNCLRTHIEEPMNANPHPRLDSNGPEWEAIRRKNTFDIELVAYARELYKEQGEMIERARGKRTQTQGGDGGGGVRGTETQTIGDGTPSSTQ